MQTQVLPLNWISLFFSPLDAKTLPYKMHLSLLLWIGCKFLPLVGNAWIKAINASMCFSNRQRALQHAKKWDIDKEDSHIFSTSIANKIGRNI
jgi:hypothetical protein